jgi:VanZ family protein
MRQGKSWLPVFLWMGFIFWMSTGTFSEQNTSLIFEPVISLLMPDLQQHEVDAVHGVVRKAGHVGEYFVLGILLFRAFRRRSDKQRPGQWAFYSLLVILPYAAGDEFHQSFEASRTASLLDVCFDIAGGLLAQAVCISWYRRKQKNSSQP